jgi:hypothetical protein
LPDSAVMGGVAQGRPERVARLLGTAEAWFDARGTIIGQTEQAGDEVFAAAWTAGQAMPLEQVLAEVVAARS